MYMHFNKIAINNEILKILLIYILFMRHINSKLCQYTRAYRVLIDILYLQKPPINNNACTPNCVTIRQQTEKCQGIKSGRFAIKLFY